MNRSRRRFIRAAAAGVVGTTASLSAQMPAGKTDLSYVIKNKRIRQSVMGWCFKKHYTPQELAKHCLEIGIIGIEGVPYDVYPELRRMGMEIALVGSHSFNNGPCNPANQTEVIEALNKAIDVAATNKSPNVITFTGMRFDGMDDEEARRDCIKVWKKVLRRAEKKKVTLVLEHLNSRDSAQMKGHPGYFGDDVDFCIDMVKEIGSEHFKLLFDVYHVSIMNGDIIRRIRQYKDYIGHYHTAGNPGRGELDDTQEINYPAIMKEILKTGYKGYVAQEFIPTWGDPIVALRHAAQVCDV